MKKLAIAMVLMGASITFVSAQSTEKTMKNEADASAKVSTEMTVDSTAAVSVDRTTAVETIKVEPMSGEMQAAEAVKDAQNAPTTADRDPKEKTQKKAKAKK